MIPLHTIKMRSIQFTDNEIIKTYMDVLKVKEKFFIQLKEDDWPRYPNYDNVMSILFFINATGIITHRINNTPNIIEGWALPEAIDRMKEIFPLAVVKVK